MAAGRVFLLTLLPRSKRVRRRRGPQPPDLRHWPVLPGRAPSFLCLPKERKQRKGTPNKLARHSFATAGSLAAVFSSGRDENSLRSDIRPGHPRMKTPSLGELEGGDFKIPSAVAGAEWTFGGIAARLSVSECERPQNVCVAQGTCRRQATAVGRGFLLTLLPRSKRVRRQRGRNPGP